MCTLATMRSALCCLFPHPLLLPRPANIKYEIIWGMRMRIRKRRRRRWQQRRHTHCSWGWLFCLKIGDVLYARRGAGKSLDRRLTSSVRHARMNRLYRGEHFIQWGGWMPLTMSKKWEGERENREEKRSTCLPRSNKRNIYIYIHTHTCRSKRKCIQWVCVFAKITLSSILHSIIVVVVLSIYWMQLLYVCMYVHTTEVIACYARVATLAVRHTCARLFISDSNESERARTPWRYKATNERWMTRSLPCVGSAAYFDFSSLLLFIVFSFFLRCAKCILKAVRMVAILQFIYFRFI